MSFSSCELQYIINFPMHSMQLEAGLDNSEVLQNSAKIFVYSIVSWEGLRK